MVEDGISIEAELTDRHVSVLKIILLTTQEFSVLPELLQIFGREAFVKFLDIFSGQTIRVPTKRELRLAIRDVDIWTILSKRNDSERVKALAERYQVSRQHVRIVYDRMMEKMKPYLAVLPPAGV